MKYTTITTSEMSISAESRTQPRAPLRPYGVGNDREGDCAQRRSERVGEAEDDSEGMGGAYHPGQEPHFTDFRRHDELQVFVVARYRVPVGTPVATFLTLSSGFDVIGAELADESDDLL